MAKKLDVFIIIYQDDILIYTKDKKQCLVNAVLWVFEKLRKYKLFANFKKFWFYKDEIWFLRYIILAQVVQIKDEKIKIVRN